MRTLLLSLVFLVSVSGAAQATPVQMIPAIQVAVDAQPGVRVLRVPLHGTTGTPAVFSLPGEVRVEVPEGRVERGATSLAEGEVAEVATQTSHSRHRAVVLLRLRDHTLWPRDRVEAVVSGNVLVLRLRPAAAPAPRPAPVQVAPVAPAPVLPVAQVPVAPAPSPAVAAPQRSPSEVALRVVAALSLLGLAGWLAWRQRKRGQREVRPAAIDIVASRVLGKNQRLVVVDVDQKRFLLAASDQGGVRLVAPIDGEARGKSEKDPLNQVFADMLATVQSEEKPAEKAAEKPAAPVEGTEKPSETTAYQAPRPPRPVLQLVEDEAAPGAIAEPAPRPRPARPQSPEPAQERSTDVAGLLALRRNRQGAGR